MTAYGCDFGTLEWRFGDSLKLDLSGRTTISPTGPGNYYARCVGDIRKSDDWVLAIVNPTTEIMPAISGPLRICPNTSANLTASNCPAGWHYQWFTAEGTGHTFNTVATIQLPQIVKCRCVKPDWSWWGPEQEVSVDAPFPNLFTATSNSPVPLGGELKLTVTDISDPAATYKWIPPAGMTLPSNGTRALSIPNATTSFGGTYQVEVTSSNCQVVVQTEVAVRACDDLYIKSTVQATGQPTNQLRRKPGVKPMAFERMELAVETLDGQRIPGATYSWTVPAGVKVDVSSPKPYLIQADQVGEYKVTVSFGQGETCELKTNLSGRPCQVFTDGNCDTAPVAVDATTEPNENIPNLAVGDVFNAGDYEVTVTELTSGSQSLGWTGTGLVTQNLIAGVKIPMSVVFENIKINSCYQYYNRGENGAVVRSKVDESWFQNDPLDTKNVSISENQGKSLFANYVKVKDILRLFDCSSTQKTDLKRLILEQDALATRAQQNTDYNDEQKALILANVKEIKEKLEALLNCCAPASNGRLNIASCAPPESLIILIDNKEAFFNQLPVKVFKPLIILVNGHYNPLIPGPSAGGIEYWNYFDPNHMNSARSLFSTVNNAEVVYANGSSLFAIDSDFSDRFKKGQEIINNVYKTDWEKINGDSPIYIIGHSEGCAMAAGIGDELVTKYQKSVKEILLLSCDEGREVGAKVNSSIPTYQLEYMYWDKDLVSGNCEPEFDWVIGTDHSWRTYKGIPGVRKFGIIETNLTFSTVHGASANLSNLNFKESLSDLRKVSVQLSTDSNGKSFYLQIPLGLKNRFFKINNTILRTINLSCNN